MSLSGHCDVDASPLNLLEPIEYLAREKRSRNAAAQARLRARQRSYIEFLERTVTKLQSALALSPDRVNDIPLQMKDLREQNELLLREVEELRRQLEVRNTQPWPELPQYLHTPLCDGRPFYREATRCRGTGVKGFYVTPTHNHSPPLPPSVPCITVEMPSQASYTPDYPPFLPGYTEPPPQTTTSRRTSSSSVSENVASVPAPPAQHWGYVPTLMPSSRLNIPPPYDQPYCHPVGQQLSPHIMTPNTTFQSSWVTEGSPRCMGYVQ